MTWGNLTPLEKKGIEGLGKTILDKAWATCAAGAFDKKDGRLELSAPIGRVSKILSRLLKPGRKLVDVVAFENGKVEETSVADLKATEEKVGARAVAGSTVARPFLGCPEPSLIEAETRATAVLFQFLDPTQREDFIHCKSFVTIGAATGHRYVVTSRHAASRLAHVRRQLYDLDEKRPYCVHDDDVPASEEMLALHLLLQIPNHERYLRHLE